MWQSSCCRGLILTSIHREVSCGSFLSACLISCVDNRLLDLSFRFAKALLFIHVPEYCLRNLLVPKSNAYETNKSIVLLTMNINYSKTFLVCFILKLYLDFFYLFFDRNHKNPFNRVFVFFNERNNNRISSRQL